VQRILVFGFAVAAGALAIAPAASAARIVGAPDDDVDTLDCGENADDRDRAVMRPGDAAVNCERVRILPAS
jgi:hypothetical protein